jgi:membrane protein DedA with SNARE-associated domain
VAGLCANGVQCPANLRARRSHPNTRLTMTEIVDFLVRHGEVVLAAYVFADQIGVPVPAVPVLLAAGGLAALGKLSLPIAVAGSVIASLVADLVWYAAGRLRGSRVVGFLCRVSLEPDSCVRRTENLFLRYGVRSLLIAKFVPGLSTVAPPLAGVVGVGLTRFVLCSAGAALLWAAAWMGIGYAAGDALERAAAYAGNIGAVLGAALALVISGSIAVKWVQRRRFLKSLEIARIDAEELKKRLAAGEALAVIDLRAALDVEADPWSIPGAVRITAEELEQRHTELPRDAEIVLYCS